jgi:hypothetical protein
MISDYLYRQNDAGYTGSVTDDSAPIEYKLRTPFYSVAGLMGEWRAFEIDILGKFYASSTWTVNLYYDDDSSTIVETMSLSVTSDPQWLRIIPSRQRCRSIMIEIVCDASQRVSLTGITLFYGKLQKRAFRSDRSM